MNSRLAFIFIFAIVLMYGCASATTLAGPDPCNTLDNWTVLNSNGAIITDGKLNVSELNVRGAGWNQDSFSGDRTLDFDFSYYQETLPIFNVWLNSTLQAAPVGYYISMSNTRLRLYTGGTYVSFTTINALTDDSHVSITWNDTQIGVTIDDTRCGYVNASDIGLTSLNGGYIEFRGTTSGGTGFFIDNFTVTDVFTAEGEGPAPINEFYLSTSGSDSNDGTSIENAWLTLSHAMDSLNANDTLWILDGTWHNDSGKLATGITGTESEPIKILAYNGTPTFIGNGNSSDTSNYCLYGYIGTGYADYVTIDGLTFKDYYDNILQFGNHLTVSNISVLDYNNTGSTSFMYRGHSGLIVRDSYFYGSRYNTINLIAGRYSGGQEDLTIDDVLIINNTIKNNYNHAFINLAGNYNNVTISGNELNGSNQSMIFNLDIYGSYGDVIDGYYVKNNTLIDSEVTSFTSFYVKNASISNNTISSNLAGSYSFNLFNSTSGLVLNNNNIEQDAIFSIISNATLDSNNLNVNDSASGYNTTVRKYVVRRVYTVSNTAAYVHPLIRNTVDPIFPIELWENANVTIENTDNQLMSAALVSNPGDYGYTIGAIVATSEHLNFTMSVDDYDSETRFLVTQYDYSLTPETTATVSSVSATGCTVTLSGAENVTFTELASGNTSTVSLESGSTPIAFSNLNFVSGETSPIELDTTRAYLNVPKKLTWNAGSWDISFTGSYYEAQTEITGVEVMP